MIVQTIRDAEIELNRLRKQLADLNATLQGRLALVEQHSANNYKLIQDNAAVTEPSSGNVTTEVPPTTIPPDPGGRTVLATVSYEKRGSITYFSVKGLLSSAAGSETLRYEWFYQQRKPDHSPEYTRINFASEVRMNVLDASTDFWPLADTGRFAVVSVVFINADNEASASILSNEVALDPNPGINEQELITLGSGVTWDTNGNLVTTAGDLHNPYFDFNLKDWIVYPNLATSPTTPGWSIVKPPEGYAGNTAKYLDNTPFVPYAQIYQVVKVIVGKSYRAVAFAKTTIPTMVLQIVYFKEDASVVSSAAVLIPQGQPYAAYVVNSTVPALTSYAWIRISANTTSYSGGGTIYVDSFDFFEIDNWDQQTLEQAYNEDQVRIKAQGVAQQQLKDSEVIFQKLGNWAVKDSKIAPNGISDNLMLMDGVISRSAIFAKLVVNDAAVNDMNANKLWANSIAGCKLFLDNNQVATTIDIFSESAYGGAVAGLRVKVSAAVAGTGGTQRTILTAGGVACIGKTSEIALVSIYSDQNLGGVVGAMNSSGIYTALLDGRNSTIATKTFNLQTDDSSHTYFGSLYITGASGGFLELKGAGGGTGSTSNIILFGSTGEIRCTQITKVGSGNLTINGALTVSGQMACTGVVINSIVVLNQKYTTTTIASPAADVNSLKSAVDNILYVMRSWHALIQ